MTESYETYLRSLSQEALARRERMLREERRQMQARHEREAEELGRMIVLVVRERAKDDR